MRKTFVRLLLGTVAASALFATYGILTHTKASNRQVALLNSLTEVIDQFQAATEKLEGELSHHAEGGPLDHTKFARDHIVAAMADLRKLGDQLEAMVADDLWPLPKYREMLFMK